LLILSAVWTKYNKFLCLYRYRKWFTKKKNCLSAEEIRGCNEVLGTIDLRGGSFPRH